jgi:hypothetical protein
MQHLPEHRCELCTRNATIKLSGKFSGETRSFILCAGCAQELRRIRRQWAAEPILFKYPNPTDNAGQEPAVNPAAFGADLSAIGCSDVHALPNTRGQP